MNTTIPTAHELREQAIAAVRQGQETTLTVIRNVVEAVSSATSKLPSAASKLPTAASERFHLPLADKLPSREAMVAGAYDFAGHLLAEQRKFTEEILKITAGRRPATAGDTAEDDDAADADDAAEAGHPAGELQADPARAVISSARTTRMDRAVVPGSCPAPPRTIVSRVRKEALTWRTHGSRGGRRSALSSASSASGPTCHCGSSPRRPACPTRTSARSSAGCTSRSIRALRAISDALNLSAETLLAQAGLIDAIAGDTAKATSPDTEAVAETERAIRADPRLSEDQKAALLAVYDSMAGPAA